MTIREMQDEIIRLKKENDICILAHAYQTHDILEVADHIGDSFGLCEKAAVSPHKTILMCGVRFMAETAKILSPEKTVLLSHPDATCRMAEQIDREAVLSLKKQYPDHAVAAYINTTAELKTACDVCVTSSSAVKIIENTENENIIFVPDPNLGKWVAGACPKKNIRYFGDGCPIHLRITESDIEKARRKHPNALVLVHPECRAEVTARADFAGSTTEIMDFAKKSLAEEFVIGTENSIVEHLQFAYPEKRFYPLSAECICFDMKLTTLVDVYDAVRGARREEIILDDEVIRSARHSIDVMRRLGSK